jgi:2,3-bisphosphoglycerate-dependent phosphoglycerate mutase
MQLYYIRHAQSTNNAHWAKTKSSHGRSADPELTKLGIRQAEILAEFLQHGHPDGGRSVSESASGGFGLTHLYSSLMIRSVETGTIVASRLGLKLHSWQEIHEHGGIYQDSETEGEVECLPGKDLAFFTDHFPDFVLPEVFIETGWWNRQPVETPEASQKRARAFLNSLLERHGSSDDRVGIISHGGFYNDFLWALMDRPNQDGIWFLMYNTAITRVDFYDTHVRLCYQNRVEHLTPELIT